MTSNLNKSTLNNAGEIASSSLNASNNDNPNASHNNNINNKTLNSGNMSRDAVVMHRTNQKKDPRSSSNSNNNCGNLNSNSMKLSSNQIIVGGVALSSIPATSNNNSRRGDNKSNKDNKNASSLRSSSSSSSIDKSSNSSKSSHRKLGSKSRSKLPIASPNKIPKVDRDSSPIRSKSREKDSSDGSSSTSSRTSPQSTSQSSKNRKKIINKSRKRSPSPPYRIPRRNADTKSNSSLSLMSAAGLTEEEQSGSLIVSPPHPPTFKEIRPNARQRNYIRRNKDGGTLSPDHSSQSAVITAATVETRIESASKDEDLRAALLPPVVTAVSALTEKSK